MDARLTVTTTITDEDRTTVLDLLSAYERGGTVEAVAQAFAEARAAGYAAGLEAAAAGHDDVHASGYAEGRRSMLDEIMTPSGPTEVRP